MEISDPAAGATLKRDLGPTGDPLRVVAHCDKLDLLLGVAVIPDGRSDIIVSCTNRCA